MNDFNQIENVGGGRKYSKPQTKILPLTKEATEYLTNVRKLDKATLEGYRLGCNKSGEIVIPYYDENDQLQLIKFRHPIGKLLKRKRQNNDGSFDEYEAKTVIEPGGKPILLGSQLCLPSEGPLVICFGDYDAMTVAQDGVPNCVSLPFGDKGFDFIKEQWQFLESFSEIIIYPDNDTFPNPDAELRAKKKLDELANRLGKYRVRIVNQSDRFSTKDANELLQKKGVGFNRKAIENAEWYPSGIVAVADYIEEEMQEGTPIGIRPIDEATGGLSGGQLIIVSGDNGAGKTSNVLNWVANFVDQRIPVMIWSGEQKVGKIRYWFERVAAGPNNLKSHVSEKTGFTFWFPLEEFKDKIREWYRDYLYQYTEVNIDAEQFFASAELAVRRFGCGLIVADNLMAFTGGEGDAYYQAQGDFTESCKRFAEKWNIPFILICHNKKEDEGKKVLILPDKNSIEGSKKIQNWADIIFQMVRLPETRKVEFNNSDGILRLCKSRESGILEDVGLKYEPHSNRFCQKTEEGNIYRQFGWEKTVLF
ncbi:MAG TPA: DnaB-like helicase C-terminal domain-containing protein [Pyrinomonadaceae bacterium]|nr:DnaB-like helicase C-terminal domain-containing protein [Pyrinomonadaceae bacterium]